MYSFICSFIPSSSKYLSSVYTVLQASWDALVNETVTNHICMEFIEWRKQTLKKPTQCNGRASAALTQCKPEGPGQSGGLGKASQTHRVFKLRCGEHNSRQKELHL